MTLAFLAPIMKGASKEILSNYFETYKLNTFNRIKTFEFLVCAFYKKPIELYRFFLYILGFLTPLYTLNQTRYNVQFLTIFMAQGLISTQ